MSTLQVANLPGDIELIAIPDGLSKQQIQAIKYVLYTIKNSECLGAEYVFKSIKITTRSHYLDELRVLEVLATTGRVGNDYLNHSFQVFIGGRGGLSAYHGPKSKRHGPGCILTNGRLPR